MLFRGNQKPTRDDQIQRHSPLVLQYAITLSVTQYPLKLTGF